MRGRTQEHDDVAARLRALVGGSVDVDELKQPAPQEVSAPKARARLVPAKPSVAAMAVVAVLAAVVLLVIYWRGRPAMVPVNGLNPSASAMSGANHSTPPLATAATVIVDVSGKVRRPGVVTLRDGQRVADALKLAGGPLPGVDLTGLNLAAKVRDGEQILVGVRASGGTAGSAEAAGGDAAGAGPIDLNNASPAQLDALPGVGPVLAGRIVDYRTAHGTFRSVDDLRNVPGIGPSLLAKLRPQVSV